MANEVNFMWITGKTLTFSVYESDGTARETGTALTETPASSGLYLGTPTTIADGDNVVIKEGTVVVGGGEYSVSVWDETMSEHLTEGTTGTKLNRADRVGR